MNPGQRGNGVIIQARISGKSRAAEPGLAWITLCVKQEVQKEQRGWQLKDSAPDYVRMGHGTILWPGRSWEPDSRADPHPHPSLPQEGTSSAICCSSPANES